MMVTPASFEPKRRDSLRCRTLDRQRWAERSAPGELSQRGNRNSRNTQRNGHRAGEEGLCAGPAAVRTEEGSEEEQRSRSASSAGPQCRAAMRTRMARRTTGAAERCDGGVISGFPPSALAVRSQRDAHTVCVIRQNPRTPLQHRRTSPGHSTPRSRRGRDRLKFRRGCDSQLHPTATSSSKLI